MAKQLWLEMVERRLLAGKLPQEYIRRFMDELADHFDDMLEENMSREANVLSRLGEPKHVADAAVVVYEKRTFFGRHPSAKFWVFGVSPMAAMSLLFVLACLGIGAVAAICERCGIPLSGKSWFGRVDPAVLNWGFAVVTTIAPAALLTFAYCRIAKRFSIGMRWILAACGMLSLVAMLPIQSITLSDMPGKSLWTIGLSLPPSMPQCVQLLVPLAVGLWFMRSSGQHRSQENRLSMST